MTENFIRVWNNFVPKDICEDTINSFEEILNNPDLKENIDDNSNQFQTKNLGRKDFSIFLENPIYNKGELCSKYLYLLNDCVTEYVEEFGQLRSIPLSNRFNLKLQKTPPLGGYHVWHYENGDRKEAYSRELVWMIYLNDLPEGEGETEFLFQKKRIRPTQGTVIIWPAGLTHVHRGLTVYSKPKYVLTGWYYKNHQ